MNNVSMLEVSGLKVALPAGGDRAMAVAGMSFSVGDGEIVCVVGESGSGKSVAAHTIMGLLPPALRVAGGGISFKGRNLLGLTPEAMRKLRGSEIGMIFQEPMTALNPVYAVGRQIDEALWAHRPDLRRSERRARVLDAMAEMNLPDLPQLYDAYPHELSGGQRQRVLIAAAMILQPSLLIADEPTTALDVTTQAQILAQIKTLQRQRGMGVLFITHDFGVVAEIADRVIVMNKGAIVEMGPVLQILESPTHDYTRQLIAAVPKLEFPAPRDCADKAVVLDAKGVSKTYRRRRGARPALVPTDIHVRQGETVGIIGESGSGKSTLARCIANVVEPSGGTVSLRGRTWKDDRRALRQRVQMIFQDPYRSLNPRRTAGQSIMEGPMNFGARFADARDRAQRLLHEVGLDASALDRYPHQFSGGQRQRICIARALAMEPEVLVADEAVSALDVTVQAQVVELLSELQKSLDFAMLFITHDLRVAARICDRVVVMQSGEIVEQGTVAAVYGSPTHSYTQSLIAAVPGIHH